MDASKKLADFLLSEIDFGRGYSAFKVNCITKLINGNQIKNLILSAPHYYKQRQFIQEPNINFVGQEICIKVKIIGSYKKNELKPLSRINPLCFELETAAKADLEAVFFAGNEAFYKQKLLPFGSVRYLSAKLDLSSSKNTKYNLIHPSVFVTSPSLLYPIYHLAENVTDANLVNFISKAVDVLNGMNFQDWIDTKIQKRFNLPDFKTAIQNLHFAKIQDDYQNSLKRLAFDELLAYYISYDLKQKQRQLTPKIPLITPRTFIDKCLKMLPFSLTDDQKKCLDAVLDMQKSTNQKTALIQGDVGSGKTVIALLSMLNAVEAGNQACIMAPTFILASQHFRFFEEYCSKLGVRVVLFTGRDKGKPRENKAKKIANGEYDIIIGTHALFHSLNFKNLALVVIDEQHRFGVEQRFRLTNKAGGQGCDTLLMTATPIPRSLALSLYHNIPHFEIRQKPAGRQEIETLIFNENKIDEIKSHISKIIQEGEKVYWICPLVEENEKLDLISVEERYKDFTEYFGKDQVDLVHGKMSEEERESKIMRFLKSEVKILIATTVVEVGVNVPDATLMVIEHATRFGLSALHQLRGRVGRGDKKSRCFLIYDKRFSKEAKERLSIMRKTNDGFEISEADLKIRGLGNILGRSQSGFEMFRFSDIIENSDMVNYISENIEYFLQQINPTYINLLGELFGYELKID